jgi:hypothetical protein
MIVAPLRPEYLANSPGGLSRESDWLTRPEANRVKLGGVARPEADVGIAPDHGGLQPEATDY